MRTARSFLGGLSSRPSAARHCAPTRPTGRTLGAASAPTVPQRTLRAGWPAGGPPPVAIVVAAVYRCQGLNALSRHGCRGWYGLGRSSKSVPSSHQRSPRVGPRGFVLLWVGLWPLTVHPGRQRAGEAGSGRRFNSHRPGVLLICQEDAEPRSELQSRAMAGGIQSSGFSLHAVLRWRPPEERSGGLRRSPQLSTGCSGPEARGDEGGSTTTLGAPEVVPRGQQAPPNHLRHQKTSRPR